MSLMEQLGLEVMVAKLAEKADNELAVMALNEVMDVAWRKLPWKECDLLMNATCNLNPYLSRDGEIYVLSRTIN